MLRDLSEIEDTKVIDSAFHCSLSILIFVLFSLTVCLCLFLSTNDYYYWTLLLLLCCLWLVDRIGLMRVFIDFRQRKSQASQPNSSVKADRCNRPSAGRPIYHPLPYPQLLSNRWVCVIIIDHSLIQLL